MATIPTDVQKRIDDMYNQQRNAQLGELRANQQRETNAINTQKKETGQQYYDKRNQADVVNFQNRRALQEMMAASGLSRSGENVTGQVGLQAARQNVLGGLNREEQGILNSLTQRINEINDPSKANNIISAIESQRSAALAEALERAIQRAEERKRFEEQLAWEKEQFNRQMAAQAARRASSGGGSRRSSSGRSSSSRTSSSQNQSLGDLLTEFRNSDQSGLPILQRRSVVSSRVPLQSHAEALAAQQRNSRHYGFGFGLTQ